MAAHPSRSPHLGQVLGIKARLIQVATLIKRRSYEVQGGRRKKKTWNMLSKWLFFSGLVLVKHGSRLVSSEAGNERPIRPPSGIKHARHGTKRWLHCRFTPKDR